MAAAASAPARTQAHIAYGLKFLRVEAVGQASKICGGVDEVGVGALAGPVAAAAVLLRLSAIAEGLADSKLLTSRRRAVLFTIIREVAVAMAVGRVEVEESRSPQGLLAVMEARRRAVEALPTIPTHVLVDGRRRIIGRRLPQCP